MNTYFLAKVWDYKQYLFRAKPFALFYEKDHK